MNEKITFKERNGRIVRVTPFNTRITYLNDRGDIAVIPTVKARLKYAVWVKTATIRHYWGLLRLFRDYSVY